MLSEIQNLAFRIHHIGFSYLPLHPIIWNFKHQKFQFTNTKSSRNFCVFSLFLCIVIVASCMYTILTHLYISPRPNFNTGIIALHSLCAFVVGIPLAGAILALRHPETMAGNNALIELQGSTKEQGKKVGMMDLMLLGIATAAPPLPFIALLTTALFTIDPFYFIYGDLLGDPGFKHTSPLVYTIFLIFRLFPILCGFECARSISLSVMFIFLVMDLLQKQFKIMIASKISDIVELKNTMLQFLHLTIICISIRASFQESLSFAISSSFWATVVGVWVIMNSYHSVPWFLYTMICVVMTIVALGVFFGLTILSKFCDQSENLTGKIVGKSREMYANCKTVSMRKELLTTKKRTNALETIKIYYHPFLPINAEFCRSTASNLVDRIFDVLLIF